MLFRVAEKQELKALYDMLAEKNAVVGPVRTGTDRKDLARRLEGDVRAAVAAI